MDDIKLSDIAISEPSSWVIRGVLGGLTVLWGQPGTKKTFLAISMAVAVASGKSWYGSAVGREKVVLYVLGEGGRDLFRRRAQEACRVAQVNPQDLLLWVRAEALDLSTPRKAEAHFMEWDNIMPDLIIVDTLSRCMPGDENAQEDMQAFISAMDVLRDHYCCAVLVIHHEGYSKGHERGSSVLPGAVDVSIKVTAKQEGDREVLLLDPTKLRDLDTDSFMHRKMMWEAVDVVDERGQVVMDDFGDKVNTLVIREHPEWTQKIECAKKAFKSVKVGRTDKACVGFKEWHEACDLSKSDLKKSISIIVNNQKEHGIGAVDVGQYNYTEFIQRGIVNPFLRINQPEYGTNYDTEEQLEIAYDEEMSGV
jgi:hypothetical protein